MKNKTIYYSSMILNWIVGLIGVYISVIIIFTAPIFTPLGDLDQPVLSASEKRMANIEIWGIRLVGLLIFSGSILWLVYFKKIANIISTKKNPQK